MFGNKGNKVEDVPAQPEKQNWDWKSLTSKMDAEKGAAGAGGVAEAETGGATAETSETKQAAGAAKAAPSRTKPAGAAAKAAPSKAKPVGGAAKTEAPKPAGGAAKADASGAKPEKQNWDWKSLSSKMDAEKGAGGVAESKSSLPKPEATAAKAAPSLPKPAGGAAKPEASAAKAKASLPKPAGGGAKEEGMKQKKSSVESHMSGGSSENSSAQNRDAMLPGLEPLYGVTRISYGSGIALVALESKNLNRNYLVTDQAGVEIYYGAEKVNGVSEALCQGFRTFNIGLYDVAGDLIITLKQTCSLSLCLFRGECAGAKVKVVLGDGRFLGAVNQICSCCIPSYEVLDSKSLRVMTIVGKFGRVCFRCPAKSFRVFADARKDDDVETVIVATIGRRYVDFKEELPVHFKALILAAMFLIELDYFRSCRGLLKAIAFIIILVAAALVYRLSPSAFHTKFNLLWPAEPTQPPQ